jgi:hypothetical protein
MLCDLDASLVYSEWCTERIVVSVVYISPLHPFQRSHLTKSLGDSINCGEDSIYQGTGGVMGGLISRINLSDSSKPVLLEPERLVESIKFL